MKMMATCWVCRIFHEAWVWAIRWPSSRDGLQRFIKTFIIVCHSFALMVESSFHALFVWATEDAAGRHPLWLGTAGYFVYHLALYPWEPVVERSGRVGKCKFVFQSFVSEAIGEKMCIIAGPFCAYAIDVSLRNDDDDDSKELRSDELLEIATVYFAMKEVVDMLGLVVVASYGIYAPRVKPHMRARNKLVIGFLTACIYGFVKIAALGVP